MNKVLKLIFITFLFCFLCINSSCFAANNEEYIRVGLLQGQTSVVISAENDFVIKDVDNNKNYKFSKANNVNIHQSERKVYIDKKAEKQQL